MRELSINRILTTCESCGRPAYYETYKDALRGVMMEVIRCQGESRARPDLESYQRGQKKNKPKCKAVVRELRGR